MFRLRLVPERTDIPFMAWRKYGFAASGALMVLSVVLVLVQGLNYGIDFRGGILLEVKTPQPVDLGALRAQLTALGIGAIELQGFGEPDDVLIRIERQRGEEVEQLAAVDAVKASLDQLYGAGVDYRRTEFVGPKVGSELIVAGVEAVAFALALMLVYIWFRFEWQFGVGAVAALIHDVTLTVGMFALTGLEFNLTTVAAILLIVGYSMNDTVVVYDRVRENLRKYKQMPLPELLSRSINDTLSRTLMTSLTTLLALVALYVLGGLVIRDFSFAMIWGIVVGTYSSIFIAAPLLILLGLAKLGRGTEAAREEAASGGR
ncbi:MAG TPA: protein translocase subunit SecF [Alphaproteobacteria bacterium]